MQLNCYRLIYVHVYVMAVDGGVYREYISDTGGRFDSLDPSCGNYLLYVVLEETRVCSMLG